MDLATYARVVAALEGCQPDAAEELLASLGQTRAALAEAQRDFDRRLAHDPKLKAELAARVLVARGRGAAAALPAPRAARHIRAGRCPQCGGYKRTEPRTPYVYCDYCGALFDYDVDLARELSGGVRDEDVFALLVDGVRPEIQRAFVAGDDAAYRAAWRWPYEMDMTICPWGWAPRIGDPAYREAMIDFSVETCVVHNRDEERRAAGAALQQAQGTAAFFPSRQAFEHYLATLRATLALEVASFRRAGLFELHPDRLDESTYLRLNLLLNVLGWRGKTSDADFDLLLELAGARTTRVEVAAVALGPACCGHCAGKLLVVEGARVVVCEACGHQLDRSARFACPSCGAQLLAPAAARSTTCAWCASVLNIV